MSESTQPEVDVDRLAEVQAEGAWVLDVRRLSTRHTEVPTDREVYVVCGSGGRSAAATEALNGAGYRAVNVAGGTKGWIEAGNPVETGTEPS
jgi:rhodanese-related sulfurtransferase